MIQVLFSKAQKYNNFLIINVAFFYVVGIILHIIPWTLETMKWLTPFVLFFFGFLSLFMSGLWSKPRFLIWLALCFVMTLVLEIVGVATSMVFGSYYYGEVLGYKFFEVPLVIGLNWVVVILGFLQFSIFLFKNPVLRALTAAILSLGFDFIMEPVAVNLGYWTWDNGIIPLQNYLAWFMIALVFSFFYLAFVRTEHESGKNFPCYYVAFQCVFFIALRIGYLVL
ncbi:MAG: carotenoid biosynthesis protein [Spirochaetales bacterium]|nr:carotenoid biosynthesis protein [Spirochaetales bacterium]